jgi:hypothetical protein
MAAREKIATQHSQMNEVPVTTVEEHTDQVDKTLQHALILSLSSEWDIVPMWGYYADHGRGMVIGFDSSALFFQDHTTGKVNYSEALPVVTNSFAPAIFTKFSQWQHEEEYRSLRVLTMDQPDRTLCGGIHLFKFCPETVREVLFGPRMSPEDNRKVSEILQDRAYAHVAIYETKADTASFKLDRVRLH